MPPLPSTTASAARAEKQLATSLKSASLAQRARAIANHNLTRQEWRQYRARGARQAR